MIYVKRAFVPALAGAVLTSFLFAISMMLYFAIINGPYSNIADFTENAIGGTLIGLAFALFPAVIFGFFAVGPFCLICGSLVLCLSERQNVAHHRFIWIISGGCAGLFFTMLFGIPMNADKLIAFCLGSICGLVAGTIFYHFSDIQPPNEEAMLQ